MIAHVVLFQPRGDVDDRTRALFLESVAGAASEIPSIRRFRIGRRLLHGLPGYEQAMTAHYGYAAIIEFDDARGLTEYLQHPAHAVVGDLFSTAAERALAYDFDLTDATDPTLAEPSVRHPG